MGGSHTLAPTKDGCRFPLGLRGLCHNTTPHVNGLDYVAWCCVARNARGMPLGASRWTSSGGGAPFRGADGGLVGVPPRRKRRGALGGSSGAYDGPQTPSITVSTVSRSATKASPWRPGNFAVPGSGRGWSFALPSMWRESAKFSQDSFVDTWVRVCNNTLASLEFLGSCAALPSKN